MLKKLYGDNTPIAIKATNLVAIEDYVKSTVETLEGMLSLVIQDKMECLVKASVSIHLGESHSLFLRKEYLVAYRVDEVSINLRRLVIKDTSMIIVEIKALRDTEILIGDAEFAVVQLQGVVALANAVGWVDNTPSFKLETENTNQIMLLEWREMTNTILFT